MKKLNILFTSEYFWPKVGGGEIWLFDLACELQKRGHKITVVTSRFSRKQKRAETVRGIKILRPVNELSGSITSRIVFVWNFCFWLCKFVRVQKYDLVFSLAYNASPSSILAGRISKTPVVTSIQSHLGKVWLNTESFPKNYLQYFFEASATWFIGRFSFVHIASNFARRQLAWAIHKYKIINDFISAEQIKKTKFDRKLRSKLTDHEKYKIIIFVGALTRLKYIVELVQKIDFKKNKFLRFIIIGDGPERNTLCNFIKSNNLKKNIIYLGPKNKLEVYKHVICADTFILPSLSEQFPLTVLEALSLGTPAIVRQVGGVREIDSKNLKICKNDFEIIEKLSEIKKRKSFKINEQFLRKYSVEVIADQFEKLFYKMTKNEN